MANTPDVKLLDTATRGHHPDSPSSLQSSEACPLFENEQRDSPAAAKGTLQHKAAETGNLELLGGDEGMEQAVNKCLEYSDRVVQYFTNQHIDPLIVREISLSVGDERVVAKDGTEYMGVTSGFPDEVIYSLTLREAHILDWKFGAVPVTPTADNLQGFAYALGVFQLYPKIDTVTVHFFHPYQGWSDEQQERMYIHTFTRADIPRMELRIRTVIARKHSKSAVPTPRVDLCIWCAKKGECPALANSVIKVADKHPELEAPDVVDPLRCMIPEQAAKLYKFAGQVEGWAKASRARLTQMYLDGEIEIPGFKLVRRQERSVQSVEALIDGAVKNGILPSEITPLMSIPLTKLEELVKSKAEKGKGAQAIRKLASDWEESGATSPGGISHFLKEIKTPSEQHAIEV